jgi:hypothetical protein
MNTLTLVAAAPVKPAKPAASDLLDRAEFWWGTGGLVAALVAGAVVVGYVDRWRKRQALAAQAESGEELTSFRAMFERGEITEAEYARLRQKVAERVKAGGPAPVAPSADAAADPTAPAATAPTPPPAPRGLSGPLPDDYFDDPPPPPANGPPPGPKPPPA